MELFDNHLKVKRSTLPGAGKGLFTTVSITKGKIITEYKGKVSTWKDADHDDGKNFYLYYVSRNHVIDARGNKNTFAHYANDANGPGTIKGTSNNSNYLEKGKRVFIIAIRDIPAKTEIFVSYGKEYWSILKEHGII